MTEQEDIMKEKWQIEGEVMTFDYTGSPYNISFKNKQELVSLFVEYPFLWDEINEKIELNKKYYPRKDKK